MKSKGKTSKTPRRLTKKAALFEILSKRPELSASELQKVALSLDIPLSLIGAYRAIRSFKASAGRLEFSESNNVKTVSCILEGAADGEHLSVSEIQERAHRAEIQVHESTIYRSLAKLTALGLVTSIERKGQKFFEWKRDTQHHGHLSCINCGRTIEFYQDYLDAIARQFCERTGFEFLRIEFLLRSVCLDCRTNGRRASR